MSVRTIRTAMTAIVWTDDRTRIRAPWRILAPLLPVLGIGFTVGVVLFETVPLPVAMVLTEVSFALAVLVCVAASTRYLDHERSVWEYGLQIDTQWLRDLCVGFVIGLCGATVPFLVGISAGWFEITAVFDSATFALWIGLGLLVLANLCVGFSEELLFRGVFLTNSIEGLRGIVSTRWATGFGLLGTSVVFGVLHISSQTIVHPLSLVTWIGAGVLFGVLYLLSGDLALPIGIHAAFNIVAAGVVVRTIHPDELAAIARVEPTVQSPLVEYGGLIEVSGLLLVGVLALLWLWYSRKSTLDLVTPDTCWYGPNRSLDNRD